MNAPSITPVTLAKDLLDINAIVFLLEKPLQFKSGLISPVYVDNRSLIYHPMAWHDVIHVMSRYVTTEGLEFDVIAGVETAGIPHCSVLAFQHNVPSIFVRKQAKTHGTKNRIEGGSVKGKRVLLIEDHISTGLSSLDAVGALRDNGAIVTDCISITSYAFKEATEAFAKANVKPHTLLTFDTILDVAVENGRFNQKEKEIIADWLTNPWPWAEKNGFKPVAKEN
ncbi:MAG: orotate phosphoribosyltransferase [Saezia sp.]